MALLGARPGSSAGRAEGPSAYDVGVYGCISDVGGTPAYTPTKAEPSGALMSAASTSTSALASSTSDIGERVSTLSRDVASLRQELRETYGAAIHALEAQVVQNMKIVQLALDHAQQEQHHELQSILGGLESQFNAHARELLDVERRDQKKALEDLDSFLRDAMMRNEGDISSATQSAFEELEFGIRKLEFGIREDIVRMAVEHSENLSEHATEHHTALESLRADLRSEMAQLAASRPTSLDSYAGGHQEALELHEEEFENQPKGPDAGVCAELATHADTHSGHRQHVEEFDGQPQREVSRIEGDRGERHAAFRASIRPQGMDLSALAEVETRIRSEFAAHSEDGSAKGQARRRRLEELDQRLQKQMARTADNNSSIMKEPPMQHTGQSRGSLQAMLEDVAQELPPSATWATATWATACCGTTSRRMRTTNT